MTTAKRLGLVTLALITLGAGAAYYATMMALKGYGVLETGINYLILLLVAALTGLILLVFWRSLHRSVETIASQLEQMSQSGQIGLVMPDAGDELAPITKPLNEFLTAMRGRMDKLRSQNRELQIQSVSYTHLTLPTN